MRVGLIGQGPAVDAGRAALVDGPCEAIAIDPTDVRTVDLAIAVDRVGASTHANTHRAARQSDIPWIAIELGGIGGHERDDLHAAITGFGPGTGCFDCLGDRVAANDHTGESVDADATVPRFAGAIAGRAAVRHAADLSPSILGRILEIPHATRRFLPIPTCRCRAARDWTLDLRHDPVDETVAMERMERSLDSRIGIVAEVGEVASFPAPYYLAELGETAGFSDATAPRQAAGVAVDWNAAFRKAIGEALERYSAGIYRTGQLQSGPPEAIPAAIDPAAFVRPDTAESGNDSTHRWVPGRDLGRGSPVALPAGVVFFPPPAPTVRPGTTTGLGLGSSTVDAVLAGLYETIERDAAMLAWYSSYEPLELEVAHEAFETLRARAASEGLAVTALLLTQDIDVPVVGVAVHRSGGEWPRFAMGMGASLDPAAAATSALAEALQNWMELRGMGPDDAAQQAGAIGEYGHFPDRARAFLTAPTSIPAASVGPEDPPSGAAELETLVDRVAAVDLDVYAVRVTPADVAELGFEAVRTLVPAAQPLFTDDPYFGERVTAVPATLGFEPRLDRHHHPYP